MRVSDLFIYPLKSARGIALASTEIDAYGLPGDRRAMVTDADGHFITQRELQALARIDVRPEAGAFRLLMQGKSDIAVCGGAFALAPLNGVLFSKLGGLARGG